MRDWRGEITWTSRAAVGPIAWVVGRQPGEKRSLESSLEGPIKNDVSDGVMTAFFNCSERIRKPQKKIQLVHFLRSLSLSATSVL